MFCLMSDQRMKSFHVYLSDPANGPFVPKKFASEYTKQEKTDFRKQVKKAVSKRNRLILYFFGLMVLYVVGLKSSPFTWVTPLPFVLMFIVLLCAMYPPLKCPGCQNLLEDLDNFCPECGQPNIWKASNRKADCDQCGIRMRRGKRGGRSWTIKYCSFCGVSVDENGFGF